MKGSEIGGTIVQDTPPVVGPYKTLAKNEINGLSFRETTPWLQLLGIKQRNKTLEERKQDLYQHFEGKSESYVLRMWNI